MKRAEPRHDSDCVASALASVLELPIDDLPDFWKASKLGAGEQYEATRAWLTERGYHWYYGECKPRLMRTFVKSKRERGVSWPPTGLWIGRVTRVEWLCDGDPGHAIVMRNHRCLFNPSGTIKDLYDDDVFLVGYYLLIPLDPARSP